jgi:hypothetical protein
LSDQIVWKKIERYVAFFLRFLVIFHVGPRRTQWFLVLMFKPANFAQHCIRRAACADWALDKSRLWGWFGWVLFPVTHFCSEHVASLAVLYFDGFHFQLCWISWLSVFVFSFCCDTCLLWMH